MPSLWGGFDLWELSFFEFYCVNGDHQIYKLWQIQYLIHTFMLNTRNAPIFFTIKLFNEFTFYVIFGKRLLNFNHSFSIFRPTVGGRAIFTCRFQELFVFIQGHAMFFFYPTGKLLYRKTGVCRVLT